MAHAHAARRRAVPVSAERQSRSAALLRGRAVLRRVRRLGSLAASGPGARGRAAGAGARSRCGAGFAGGGALVAGLLRRDRPGSRLLLARGDPRDLPGAVHGALGRGARALRAAPHAGLGGGVRSRRGGLLRHQGDGAAHGGEPRRRRAGRRRRPGSPRSRAASAARACSPSRATPRVRRPSGCACSPP